MVTHRGYADRHPRGPCAFLHQARSAVANAEHNNSSDLDELIVKNVLVDEGPYGKRHRPRARGRVNQIIKRTSHITIVVSDGQEVNK